MERPAEGAPHEAAGGREAPGYRAAGVDLEGKRALVQRLARIARTTPQAGVLQGIGGFAGALALGDAAGAFEDPVLVAGADGVGTKLELLVRLGRHRVAGVDCVAMCVNDVVAAGGRPLFFLDYLAMGRLDPEVASEVVEGVAEGCREAGCTLLGGETAEMPGFYGPGMYELAGFCVGVADRAAIERGMMARPGDVLVGLGSSGLHSNGFSLVRRILEQAGADLGAPAPFGQGPGAPPGTSTLREHGSLGERSVPPSPGIPLGEALTQPTRIYARAALAMGAAVEVHALAHITGGGLPDNLARVLPAGTRAVVERGSWPEPEVFGWLEETGRLSEAEMFRVFNMGLGMVAAVAPADAEAAVALATAAGYAAWVVGRVEGPGLDPATTPARGIRFTASAKQAQTGGWVEIVDR
ncbi:MAG: phosphoribosylformylglycinamidine cyclo-ligase [Limnochordaceae bacterium]|nr:phosphoribosylformylglycinamidine cyclo-ligase [Limnochordaceae bacterium]